MTDLKYIEIEINEHIATIWLNRPESRNALNSQLLNNLIKAFNHLEKRDGIMIILLRGKGKSFCAGADLKWFLKSGNATYTKNLSSSKKLAKCFHTIYKSNKVVINLIHGHAFGGAFGFIGTGDFSFALKDTKFGLPELKLGLLSSVIMPYVLLRLRLADLKELVYTSETFTTEKALQIGLIDKVFDKEEDMETEAISLANKISKSSLFALNEGKKLVRRLNRSTINKENIKYTAMTLTRLKLLDDTQQRIAHFKAS